MKLFTKDIDKKLFAQYTKGSDLANQMVVAKIFNPYGRGTWYIINSDPDDPDYLWAIVDLMDVEVGSVSRSELESILVPPFRLNLERDTSFSPTNALELYNGLRSGKMYQTGGTADSAMSNDPMIGGTMASSMKNGGGVDVKIPPQGTMISRDKKNKLDYKKVGNNYEFIVYEAEPNPVENYSRTSFKKKSNGVVTMNYNQFINYIYSEGYVDDKMAKGGKISVGDFVKVKPMYGNIYGEVTFSNDNIIVIKNSMGKTFMFHPQDLIKSMGKGGNIEMGDMVNITDDKSMFTGKSGVVLSQLTPKTVIVKILVDGNERNVVVRKSGLVKVDSLEEGGIMTADEVYSYDTQDGEFMAKGGNIKQIPVGEEYRYKPSSSIESDIMAKVSQQMSGLRFAGNLYIKGFSGDVYLYFLDSYDRDFVSNIGIKPNERIYRYVTRATAIGGMIPLLKVNLDSGLVYFNEASEFGDESVVFSKKGVKAEYINLVRASEEDYYANGGGVGYKSVWEQNGFKEYPRNSPQEWALVEWSTNGHSPMFKGKMYFQRGTGFMFIEKEDGELYKPKSNNKLFWREIGQYAKGGALSSDEMNRYNELTQKMKSYLEGGAKMSSKEIAEYSKLKHKRNMATSEEYRKQMDWEKSVERGYEYAEGGGIGEDYPFEYKGYKYNVLDTNGMINDRGQKLYSIKIKDYGNDTLRASNIELAKKYAIIELDKIIEEENTYAKGGGVGATKDLSQIKKYQVYIYYGGEQEDKVLTTYSLETAKKLAKQGEHAEIIDTTTGEMVEFKYANGGGVDRFSDFDLNKEGNFEAIIDGKKYEIIYRDDVSQMYDLFEDGKLINSSKSVRDVMKFSKGGGVGEYKVYDEIIIMDDDTKDAILDDEELQKFIKPTDFLRNKNSQTFIWIDRMEYDEFDKLANFLGYKYATGGGVGKFFSKAKELGKKGYEKSKAYTKEKVKEQKRKIAVDVINDTDNRTSGKANKDTLDKARQLVIRNYAKGGVAGDEFSQQDFDKLKKGDEIMITYESGISRSNNVSLQVKSKTIVGKGKSYQSEKITFINKENPTGVKYYAYKRANGNVGFAIGDMAIWGVQQTNKMAKGGATPAQKRKIGKVMREWKEGELNIGKSDKKVKSQKQAVAIALSQAGLSKKEEGGKMMGWKHKRK